LGTETHLGANWGSQTYTHRIREEREGATCQHLIGPPQHVSATCHNPIGPCQQVGPTLVQVTDRWAPPQCHVAVSQWSTSPSLPHGITPQGHLTLSVPHGITPQGHLTLSVPHGITPQGNLTLSVPHGIIPQSHLSSINRPLELKRGCLT
jgi:hypothetical protein